MAEKNIESENGFSPASQLAGWIRQGISSFMTAQKILLDLTAQQNALVIGMVRERLSDPLNPGIAMAEVADKAVENLTAAGKILLDLAGSETELVMDGVKEVMPLPDPAGRIANLIRHRMMSLIDWQKSFLDAAAEQTHEAAESYREGKGLMTSGAHLAELARKSVEDFVENEKKFLELVVDEVNGVSTVEDEVRKPSQERYKVLAHMAREGGEKYIDAQKKLLHLVINQMENARKTVGHRLDSMQNDARTSWSELADKSVQNLATAQKSLMEAVAPPKEKAAPAERKRKATRVRARTAKAEEASGEAA